MRLMRPPRRWPTAWFRSPRVLAATRATRTIAFAVDLHTPAVIQFAMHRAQRAHTCHRSRSCTFLFRLAAAAVRRSLDGKRTFTPRA